MPLSKTINNYETFIEEFKLEKTDDKPYLDAFFKKKFIIVDNKRIIHPKLIDLKRKIDEIEEQNQKLKKLLKFWKKERDVAKNYYLNIKLNKYLKRKFWQHKLKQIVNSEYKEDVLNTKLTEDVLMDPAYQTLLDTFLVDYDYRKKLCETINKSIIYKDNKIGDNNKKKQKYKIVGAQAKIDEITEQINKHNLDIKANKTIIKYIKQLSF